MTAVPSPCGTSESDTKALCRRASAPPVAVTPDDIRAQGWAVAVHNDYRLNGVPHTFWLFTKGDACVKGEGRTDAEALSIVRAALAATGTPGADRQGFASLSDTKRLDWLLQSDAVTRHEDGTATFAFVFANADDLRGAIDDLMGLAPPVAVTPKPRPLTGCRCPCCYCRPNLHTNDGCKALAATGTPGADRQGFAIPEYLFDGYAVYWELTEREKEFVSPEAVSAVLDVVVRLMRSEQPTPLAGQQLRERYEFVRKLSPVAFRELWSASIRGEGTFDELVDAGIKAEKSTQG